jgi:hypothetical protein
MLLTQKYADNTFIVEESTTLSVGGKKVCVCVCVCVCGSVTVLSEFMECYLLLCTALGNVSIFKSTLLPVAGSLTATAWIWNVAIYTADPKQQPYSLLESLQMVSYLSRLYLLMQKC